MYASNPMKEEDVPLNPVPYLSQAQGSDSSLTTRLGVACATARPADNPRSSVSLPIPDSVSVYHAYTVHPSQCSAVVQHIDAPLPVVWSFVRRFDDKHFVRSCHVISSPASGRNSVGSLRGIEVVSGLPAADSTELLEILNDGSHVISFSIVGRDHRLANYRSVTTLHEPGDGTGTVVVES
ncbi:hypothetical protein MLD38_029779 [Melastoma candidum]|uniref:Uncharacterized protein n=1 Tax=Melastoma candidum TaxID=119954 RepID=A0ACB9N500_9MYRT|nr:hypothetical protein MLD38_029779 [Melastoma candidum]